MALRFRAPPLLLETSIRISRTETVTNNQGYYTLPSLNPGNYDLVVRKPGFRTTTTRAAIKIDVAQVARIDLGLTVGEVKESSRSSADAPMLASEKATVEQVITSQKIVDLPLNGRDFTQLATLTPGAISRGIKLCHAGAGAQH